MRDGGCGMRGAGWNFRGEGFVMWGMRDVVESDY